MTTGLVAAGSPVAAVDITRPAVVTRTATAGCDEQSDTGSGLGPDVA
jgi:hypothetical protein